MNTIEAITEILKREGVQYLPCFPTTPVIEAAALGGIRPIICRQERVGVGIADGLSRVSNGDHMGVFAMQYGPGAENAYPGIATSYSDSVPILLLPLGHPRDKAGINPHYDSLKGYADITKAIEQVNMPDRTSDIMRRAFAGLRQGRGGPMAVEIPADIALEEVREESFYYAPSRPTTSQGNPSDIEAAAEALCAAHYPVILAGQGVLYANATIQSSDSRIKKNIDDLGYGLDYINSLRPVTYYKKDPMDYSQELKDKFYPKGNVRTNIHEIDKVLQLGFIAQEVKQVNDEMGLENNIVVVDEDGFHRMDYQKIVVPLVKAVQEQQDQIEDLLRKYEELAAQNQKLLDMISN